MALYIKKDILKSKRFYNIVNYINKFKKNHTQIKS